MDQTQEPTDPPTPELEITLEEWIAATQSCCGIDPVDGDDGPEGVTGE